MYLEKTSLKGYKHPDIYNSAIYNNQGMEAT